jgi:hypothetical protein
MRHKIQIVHIFLLLLFWCSQGYAKDEGWAVFQSEIIKPAPEVWKTEDWNDFQSFERQTFPHYTFEYPKNWQFTGYSVFNDRFGEKIAEISPGVIALAPNQTCYDSKRLTPNGKTNFKPFNFGEVSGFRGYSEVEFDDSPKLFLVYSYCIQKSDLAFLMTFLSPKSKPDMSKIFERVVRSFRFTEPVPNTK